MFATGALEKGEENEDKNNGLSSAGVSSGRFWGARTTAEQEERLRMVNSSTVAEWTQPRPSVLAGDFCLAGRQSIIGIDNDPII